MTRADSGAIAGADADAAGDSPTQRQQQQPQQTAVDSLPFSLTRVVFDVRL
jgi:hypothetical protein